MCFIGPPSLKFCLWLSKSIALGFCQVLQLLKLQMWRWHKCIVHYEVAVTFWQMGRMLSLNLKCPLQNSCVHNLIVIWWALRSYLIRNVLTSSMNWSTDEFTARWTIGSMHLKGILCPWSSLSLFLGAVRSLPYNILSLSYLTLPQAQSNGASQPWTENKSLVSLSLLKLFFSCILSEW